MRLLSAIKKDLEFNMNLYNLLEVLKEIAIAQYKILEKKLKVFEKVFPALGAIYDMLGMADVDHPLLHLSGKPAGIVCVTSDAGLLGGLNMSVMSQAIREAQKNKARLIIIGEKGQMYAQESDLEFVVFKGVKDETRYEQAAELRDYIMQEEMTGKLGELKIVYPYALSIVSQQVKTLALLPFNRQEQISSRQDKAVTDLILESPVGDVLEYWTNLFLGQKFFQAFGMARLAELAARFSHLENSKGKVDALNKDLKLQYFRTRHELIDKNIRELFCARLAFK
ncbi:MAG: F0F1 ATP synthase subunit gamma [Candidatus Omnitrophica bacterium]|nr:F0F1 ATP synthase subunit gamma [Candidatus Omnitrophota bacterium]MDD4940275.1 F0F1 ATP synthase subunit gamma [Candidatus Omnitrophota bacterium]